MEAAGKVLRKYRRNSSIFDSGMGRHIHVILLSAIVCYFYLDQVCQCQTGVLSYCTLCDTSNNVSTVLNVSAVDSALLRSSLHLSSAVFFYGQAQNVDVHLLQFICIYRFGSHACPLFKPGDTCARGYQ